MNYESQIRNYIRSALGALLVREISSRLDPFYADLRRCRQRCSGRAFVEKDAVEGTRDCRREGCQLHECKP